MEKLFLGNKNFNISSAAVAASCPSNIALIKYWGKYPGQIPANPSISYTLNNCRTDTKMHFLAGEPFSVETFLAGKSEIKFAEKIEKYFRHIEPYMPWILQGKIAIQTVNTFPHSSGIASSASGFGAIAKCLMELDQIFRNGSGEPRLQSQEPRFQSQEPSTENREPRTENRESRAKNQELKTTSDNRQPTADNQQPTTDNQQPAIDTRKASFLARLGSGSACRSLYGGLAVWGETPEVAGSSDLFAVQFPNEEIHPVFKNFNDWVLLIHEGEKSVSSTVGHGLMSGNPYAERRFREARENFSPMKEILKSGDMEGFIKLVEHEALTLHAMMMMSSPAFILMKTGTLEVISKIWKFRADTGLPLLFTLDAGANVHVLFPGASQDFRAENQEKIENFINSELLPHTQNGGVVKDFMRF